MKNFENNQTQNQNGSVTTKTKYKDYTDFLNSYNSSNKVASNGQSIDYGNNIQQPSNSTPAPYQEFLANCSTRKFNSVKPSGIEQNKNLMKSEIVIQIGESKSEVNGAIKPYILPKKKLHLSKSSEAFTKIVVEPSPPLIPTKPIVTKENGYGRVLETAKTDIPAPASISIKNIPTKENGFGKILETTKMNIPPPPPPPFIPMKATATKEDSCGRVLETAKISILPPPPPPFISMKAVATKEDSCGKVLESLKTNIPPPPPPPFIPMKATVTKEDNYKKIMEIPQKNIPSPPPPPPPTLKNYSTTQLKKSNSFQNKIVTETKIPVTDDSTTINKNDPNVKKLVYNTYRGLLGAYNDKANNYIATLPRSMVRKNNGIAKQLESLRLQGGLEKLNGRVNPKQENDLS